MSKFLDLVIDQCEQSADRLAFYNSDGQKLTYRELALRSNGIAEFLDGMGDRPPVVLLGHKEPDMISGMVGAMKAGSAYVPLDSSLPAGRVLNIISQLENPLVIEVRSGMLEELLDYAAGGSSAGASSGAGEEISFEMLLKDLWESGRIIRTPRLHDIAEAGNPEYSPAHPIQGDDAQYILFTSGSTGAPKGVMQAARTVDIVCEYFKCYLPEGEHLTFFNRVHFSFDVSVFDFAIALPYGHILFALTGDAEESMAKSFAALHEANPQLWISTPSYLNMCLADPGFSEELLPDTQMFVVCGETLHNSTAAKLYERFPNAKLLNTYGPTETQAITDVAITQEMISSPDPLPVGMVSPFNEVIICPQDSLEELPAGVHGEVVILGNTVALGYYGRPDLTAKVFGTMKRPNGEEKLFYRTGDEGFLDETGMLHFIGRFDTQVKINGYRIELGEVEETLNKLSQISASCVVPVSRNGIYVALAAHIVSSIQPVNPRELTRELKAILRKTLPDYMVPRNIMYYDDLPANSNGKIDRKALEAASAK